MFAVFTAPDALVVSAIVTAVAGAGWWQSRRNAKQLKPNGGTSLRDAIDRIEHKLDEEVIPRLDGHAALFAAHADRIAVVESRRVRTVVTTTEDAA